MVCLLVSFKWHNPNNSNYKEDELREIEEKNKAAAASAEHIHMQRLTLIRKYTAYECFWYLKNFSVLAVFLVAVVVAFCLFICCFVTYTHYTHTQKLPMEMCNQGSTHIELYILLSILLTCARLFICILYARVFGLVCAHVLMHTDHRHRSTHTHACSTHVHKS